MITNDLKSDFLAETIITTLVKQVNLNTMRWNCNSTMVTHQINDNSFVQRWILITYYKLLIKI